MGNQETDDAAAMARVPPPPPGSRRILNDGEIVQEGDEVLNDDAKTWSVLKQETDRIIVGRPYSTRFHMPIRRKGTAWYQKADPSNVEVTCADQTKTL